jgi:hypothetical protein
LNIRSRRVGSWLSRSKAGVSSSARLNALRRTRILSVKSYYCLETPQLLVQCSSVPCESWGHVCCHRLRISCTASPITNQESDKKHPTFFRVVTMSRLRPGGR